jgi:hypothetical protein
LDSASESFWRGTAIYIHCCHNTGQQNCVHSFFDEMNALLEIHFWSENLLNEN